MVHRPVSYRFRKIVCILLEKSDLVRIIDIELHRLKERLGSRKLTLKVSKEVKEYLITQGYQPEFGARPLRRAVERYIEDPLAEELLKGNFDNAKGVKVEFDREKLLFFPVE